MGSRTNNVGTSLLVWILIVAIGVVKAAETTRIDSSNDHSRKLSSSGAATDSSSGPQPRFIVPSPLSSVSTILLGVDFGEKITATDPTSLYTISCTQCAPGSTGDGTSKVDSLLDVNKGMLFLSIQLANPNVSTVLQVSVPAGVTTNVAGQPNSAAEAPLSYIPPSGGAKVVGKTMAPMFQVAWPVTLVAGAAGIVNPSVVADISHRALMTAMIGGIALPAMPPIYSSFSSSFGFVKLDAS